MLAMIFGHIVQFEEDPRTWAEFLRKASTGSAKAADWVGSADMAVAADVGGGRLVDHAPVAESRPLGRVRSFSLTHPWRT